MPGQTIDITRDPLAAWATVELRHMRAFVAVGEELHFGRAAARLNVSQPTVSRLMRELEGALGVRLLERDSHGTELTEDGRGLLSRSRKVLSDVGRTLASTTATGRVRSRTLAIGFLNAAGHDLLPALRDEMAHGAEPWQIHAHDLDITSGLDDVLEGLLDAGFYYLPLSVPDGLEYEVVAEVVPVAAVAITHELATRGECTFREFAAEPVFMPPMHRLWSSDYQILCRAHGVTPQFVELPSTMRETLARVALGEGVLLAASGGDFFMADGVAFVPVIDIERVQVVLVWRSEAPPPAKLIEAVRRLAQA